VVVPEGVFVHVHLKVLVADAVVNAADAALQQRPEPLDGLGVDIALDVDLG
jgi:hypothetical protein